MKPNLIFIFCDQLRRETIENEQCYTPNIDKFKAQSIDFCNGISTSPVCSPYRASLMSGMYPASVNVPVNPQPRLNGVYFPDDTVTFSNILQENKYSTGFIGKWHLDEPDVNVGNKLGLKPNDSDAFTPPDKQKRFGFDYWYGYNTYDYHLQPHYWDSDGKRHEVDKWSVEHEVDKAIEFLDDNKEEPFSLFIAHNPPHPPFEYVPQEYVDVYSDVDIKMGENSTYHNVKMTKPPRNMGFDDEAAIKTIKQYYGAVTGIDKHFGRLMDYLEENNLADNTIVVFTADHGEMLTSHGLMAKCIWYEESINVPLIFRWPVKFEPCKSDTVYGAVDHMPTILSLMGIECPKVDGTDKSKCLVDSVEDDEVFMLDYPSEVDDIIWYKENNIDYLEYGWRGVRAKDYTYVIDKGYMPDCGERVLLYDLKNDRQQMKPLNLSENAELVKILHKKLMNNLQKYDKKFLNG